MADEFGFDQDSLPLGEVVNGQGAPWADENVKSIEGRDEPKLESFQKKFDGNLWQVTWFDGEQYRYGSWEKEPSQDEMESWTLKFRASGK